MVAISMCSLGVVHVHDYRKLASARFGSYGITNVNDTPGQVPAVSRQEWHLLDGYIVHSKLFTFTFTYLLVDDE